MVVIPEFESIAATPEGLRPVCEYAASLVLWKHPPASWRATLRGGSFLYVCSACLDALKAAEAGETGDAWTDEWPSEPPQIAALEHPVHVRTVTPNPSREQASSFWPKIMTFWVKVGDALLPIWEKLKG